MTIVSATLLFLLMAGLAALPSSSVLLVVAQSATKGVKNGIATALGVVSGDLVFMTMAILGMATLAEQLGAFFVVIKYIAAAYLIWFGIGLIRSAKSKSGSAKSPISTDRHSGSGLIGSYGAGLLLTLGDVKAIFFYASLLPTFIDLGSLAASDIMLVSLITIVAVGGVKVLYALGSERAVRMTSGFKFQKHLKASSGGLMTAAGVYMLIRD